MSGTLSYRVNDLTPLELRDRLLRSIIVQLPARFEASPLDDPSGTIPTQQFEVRVQTFHADTEPLAADLIDQYDRFFQIKFFEGMDVVDFEIIT
jgi:hypothetical protein